MAKTIFNIVVGDMFLLGVTIVLLYPSHTWSIFGILLPLLLSLNTYFVMRRSKTLTSLGHPVRDRYKNSMPLYGCAVIFSLGTTYGVILILSKQLPVVMFPALLLPLSIAIYCFRKAQVSRHANEGGI